jgi:hypothetical protein
VFPKDTLQIPEQQSKSVVQKLFDGPQQLHGLNGEGRQTATVPSVRKH